MEPSQNIMRTQEVVLNANQRTVGAEALRGKGLFYYPFMFRKGEEFYFPEDPICIEEKFGKNQDLFVLKILASKNPNAESITTWIPLSSFSVAPDSTLEARMDFIEKYPVNREFCELYDFEQRVAKITEYSKSGKVLKVAEMVTLKRRKWSNKELVVDENGDQVLEDHKYPVFEWI